MPDGGTTPEITVIGPGLEAAVSVAQAIVPKTETTLDRLPKKITPTNAHDALVTIATPSIAKTNENNSKQHTHTDSDSSQNNQEQPYDAYFDQYKQDVESIFTNPTRENVADFFNKIKNDPNILDDDKYAFGEAFLKKLQDHMANGTSLAVNDRLATQDQTADLRDLASLPGGQLELTSGPLVLPEKTQLLIADTIQQIKDNNTQITEEQLKVIEEQAKVLAEKKKNLKGQQLIMTMFVIAWATSGVNTLIEVGKQDPQPQRR